MRLGYEDLDLRLGLDAESHNTCIFFCAADTIDRAALDVSIAGKIAHVGRVPERRKTEVER